MPARTIAIEGPDGTGKATQTEKLKEQLIKDGHIVVSISFPRYDTAIGRKIRQAVFDPKKVSKPFEMAKLFYEDRKAALPFILNAVDKNNFVIFDRYKYSSIAHQASKVENSERRKLISKIEYMEKDIPGADLVIFLSLPVELSQKLLKKEKKKDLHENDIDYLRRTEKIYEQLAKRKNWTKIECARSGKLLSIENIHEKIYNEVKKFFGI